MPLKRDWLDMTWEDFAGIDGPRVIAVLPIAAVEQHGPHLPVGVDTFIAEAYLAEVRRQLAVELPVVFLPLQAIGTSEEHVAYPGTLTLAPETLSSALLDIGRSVRRAGVRKLVIVNSHGGNVATMDTVARQLRARAGMFAVHCSWSRFGYPAGLFGEEERAHGIHGGDIETSIILAVRFDAVRRDRMRDFMPATKAMEREFKWLRADFPAGYGWMTQDLHPSGALGNAAAATPEKGAAALAHGAQAFIELLRDVDRFDLARLEEAPHRT